MNAEKIEQLLKTVASYMGGLREGRRLVESLQHHEDRMVIWIVTLATGTIIAVPTYVIDIKRIPGWALGLSLGALVLSLLSGIVYRLILAKLMEADAFYGVYKINAIERLIIEGSKGPANLHELGNKVLEIMDDKPGNLPELKRRLDKINSWATRLMHWPYILFAFGVVATTAVATCWR